MVGSNLGNLKQNLDRSVWEMEQYAGSIRALSGYYQTAPWNMTGVPDFLNRAVLLETRLAPEELLAVLLEIEKKLGRTREQANASRIIDNDIMFYGDKVIQTGNLTVPHPRMHLRRFNLLPINEICPDFRHPVLKETIVRLLEKCEDSLVVNRIDF